MSYFRVPFAKLNSAPLGLPSELSFSIEDATLSLSYNSLWKLLIDRKLKKKDLQNMAHLSSSVIAKMGKDQPVHLDTIVKICVALQCDISDVVTLCNKEA